MPYADIEAGRLYYEQHGQGEPVLCIHGLAGGVAGWRPQIAVWSRHYQVTAFDSRDVGRSFYAQAPYEVRDLVADAVALCDRLGLGRVHLIGISMGGAVAQEFALAYPDRVRTLTLCVSYAATSAMDRERVRLAILEAQRQSEDERAAALMLLTLSPETFEELEDNLPAMRRMVLSDPLRQRLDGYLRQLQASLTHQAGERLAALRMPVHVVGAEQDVFVPVWRSAELARLIPGARLSVIAGAGHAVNLERTAEFNAAVLDFLSNAEQGRGLATVSGP